MALRHPALAVLVEARPIPARPIRYLAVQVEQALPTAEAEAELVALAVVQPSRPLAARVHQAELVPGAEVAVQTVVRQAQELPAVQQAALVAVLVETVQQLAQPLLVPPALNGMAAVEQVVVVVVFQSALLAPVVPTVAVAEEQRAVR